MNDKRFERMTKDWATVPKEKLEQQITVLVVEVASGRAELKPAQEAVLSRMEARNEKMVEA